MRSPTETVSVYQFGVFQVDLDRRELLKHGTRIRLQHKPFQLLAELLQRPGEVVSREELRRSLWPADTFVDFDEGMNTAVKRLRGCLGDSSANPIYIETVAGSGYRFIAPVTCIESDIRHGGADASPLPEPEKPATQASTSTRLLLWSLPAVLMAAALIGLAVDRFRKHPANPGRGSIQSIAVLPLVNLSGDPSQEYFADGMTDEIITNLAKLAGPKIISRTSAMQYKGTHKRVPDIASELNVGAIVEGSVERSGDKVRVRVQLIQASTDQHMWAEEYNRELRDVLGLEADLARDIADQVQLQLSARQQQDLSHPRLLNPQAFQDYLMGRQYWALRTQESLPKALEYFQRAVQEDPNDARSYAGLAHCYIVLPMVTEFPAAEAAQNARQAAEKAIALDSSLADAHLAMAAVRYYQDWDFKGAEREFKQTLELNSNYSTAHQWYSEFLSIMGRRDESIQEIEKAIALDPLSAIVHHQAGQTFREARQYDRAMVEYREALRLNPALYVTYEAMYWALRRQGKLADAAEIMRHALPYWNPREHMDAVIDPLPRAYNQQGKTGFLRQSIRLHERLKGAPLYVARDYADLGDKEAALQQLKLSLAEHSIVTWILTDPEFDSMHSDPRFQQLLKAVGFLQ